MRKLLSLHQRAIICNKHDEGRCMQQEGCTLYAIKYWDSRYIALSKKKKKKQKKKHERKERKKTWRLDSACLRILLSARESCGRAQFHCRFHYPPTEENRSNIPAISLEYARERRLSTFRTIPLHFAWPRKVHCRDFNHEPSCGSRYVIP